MKKIRLILAALVFATMAGGMLGASAAHCGSGAGKPHDPFGSCENGTTEGGLECGSGVQGLGVLAQPASGDGLQACGAGVARAGVWMHDDDVTLFVDGDDAGPAGELGWKRVDVDQDDACKARRREGANGQWANDYEGTGSTDSVAETDACVA